MIKNYIFNICLFLLFIDLTAQTLCQEQLEINNDVSGASVGQSIFMADCTGFFSSIELYRSDDGVETTAQLMILNGQTFLGEPRYIQTVTIPQSSGSFTINLGTGNGSLAFFEDSQYTFILSNPTLQLASSSDINSYVNGQMFKEVGFINNDDLWFKLHTTTTLAIDVKELNKPTVFPNPATDHIQISGTYKYENFVIYNILGTKVKFGVVFQNEKINIQDLPIGVYYLKLNDGQTLKFLKK